MAIYLRANANRITKFRNNTNQMKTTAILTVLLLSATIVFQSCDTKEPETARDYPITPVDFTHVKLNE